MPNFAMHYLIFFFSSAYITWSHFVQCYGVFSFLTRKESKDVLCSCTRIWVWVLHLPPSNIEHLKEDEEEQQKEVGPRDF